MTEDHGPDEPGAATESGVWARSTAPQTPYTIRQVGIGFVVLVVGAIITFGLPFAFA